MTKKQRPVRTEGPISDMDYHVVGTINDPEYRGLVLPPIPKIPKPRKPQPPKPTSKPSPSYPPQE